LGYRKEFTMPKHTARRHKVAVRHAPAARPRRHGKAMRGHKSAPKMTQSPAVSMAEFKPGVIDVVEVDFLGDPVEVLADDETVTGFDDEDL